MKYLTPLFASFAATPALAHHEAAVASASPAGLIAGMALIALAGVVALRLRRAT